MGPSVPLPLLICGIYIKIFFRCTIGNQFDILLTVVVVANKGQTDMPYQGEHHTLTEQSMRHQVCPGETCCTTISILAITIHNEGLGTKSIKLGLNELGSEVQYRS